jgi:AraC-like DNA-binding protein
VHRNAISLRDINRERVCYGPDASFASFVRGWPRIVCSYHLHEEYELTQIQTSEGSLLAGDYVGSFEPGDIFFFGRNLPHLFRNWPGMTYGKRGARTHVVQFRNDFLGKEFFQTPELRFIQRFLTASERGFRIRGKLRTLLAQELCILQESDRASRLIHLLKILDCLASHPRDLETLSSLPVATMRIPLDARLERVFDYVYENFKQDVVFEKVIKLACMTPPSFSRYFRQRTTLSFTEFLNRLRVCHSCGLLTSSDLPVTEVAMQSGYSNLSYFNRQFRRLTGRAPREFRRGAGHLLAN